MIKAVAFDLDDTLYPQNSYYYETFSEYCKGQVTYSLDQLYTTFLSLGKTSDIFGDVLRSLDAYSEADQNRLFDIYNNLSTSIQAYDEVEDVFNYLKRNNIVTGIITNGVLNVQKNKLKALNLKVEPDIIILARTWGKEFEKPNKKPFEEFLYLTGLKSNEVLFVGDTIETDIVGASAIGMRTALLVRNSIAPDSDIKIIKNLNEIKEIINGQ